MPLGNTIRRIAIMPLFFIGYGNVRAQCMPGAEIKPDSGYSYLREEVKVLESIRRANDDSERLSNPPLLKDDPQRIHKEVEFYSALHDVEDDYACAETLLHPFSQSKNASIRESAASLLSAIDAFKGTNKDLTDLMELIKKTSTVEELNQLEIGKRLADLKSIQKDARMLIILGVRMSTFAVMRFEGEGEETKPVAFTITSKQHANILADLKAMPPRKSKAETDVDICIAGLTKILSTKLPFAE